MSDVERFEGADDGVLMAFHRWQAKNPAGYLIAHRAGASGMLHRVGCQHIGGPGEMDKAYNVTRTAKTCHAEKWVLQKWARENGIELAYCHDCDL